MNTRSSSSRLRPRVVTVALAACLACLACVASLGLLTPACEDPNVFLPSYQPGGPEGALEGTVTYIGPLPCTAGQHVVGAAVMLVFSAALLPPPEGLGTTAASLGTVGGDTLFAGVADRLTFNSDGSMWCPAAGAPDVTVSAPWTIAPLCGGVYEVRGFYDYAGTFDPVFSITKLPVKGDIAGGAVENATSVLMGAAPVYRKITLGALQGADAGANAGGGGGGGGGPAGGLGCPTGPGTYLIPPEGASIGGVTVQLALPLPLTLPTFYPSAVAYASYTCQGSTVTMVTPAKSDPAHIAMPSDYQIPVFNPGDPTETAGSLVTIDLTAGVPSTEVAAASAPPFSLPVTGPPAPTFTLSWQDVNGDGMLDITHDHSPANTLLPSLFPLSIFSKNIESSPAKPTDDLTAEASPVVILQGVTLYKNLLDTVLWGSSPPPNNAEVVTDVFVGLPPAALCIQPADPSVPATLVVSREKDCQGHPILTNGGNDTVGALEQQFGRHVNLVYGCLPEGRYAMNLVYGTGQAWSDPNESGVCQPGETESKDGNACTVPYLTNGSRAILHSQDRVLTISAPVDASYCVAHPTPAACCPSPKAGATSCTPDCKTCQ